jgi:5-methylcytosine-specific restriction endonuclease McrA
MYAMFQTENEFLQNLIVLSPKLARKKFRESIFEAWHWKCMYCNSYLSKDTATIDHIKPKFKGGKSTRNNMGACCTRCNANKGSRLVFDYYNETHPHYSEERASKIKQWIEQNTLALNLTSNETKAIPYLCHDVSIGWIAN